MTAEEIVSRYPKVPLAIAKQYKEADTHIWFNTDDPNLFPIRVELPKPPEYHLIDGFGLPARAQKFEYQVYPERLKNLERRCNTITKIWEVLDVERDDYKEEIAWIQKQWDRRFNGYWCFINGKPTFIDGWHYTYVNFWKFKNKKLPQYRSANRKFFLFNRFAYTYTYDFANRDEFGRPIPNDDGFYDFIDLGYRVCMGTTFPKGRRGGASNMSLCIGYCETTVMEGVISGIISMNGDSSAKHFGDILVPGWMEMPFFFKPMYNGKNPPSTEIFWAAPAKTGDVVNIDMGLQTIFNFSPTAQATFYDGDKVFFLLCDEEGKATEVDVSDRWLVLRQCLGQGSGAIIEGFSVHPSTVGEMNNKGGAAFYELCSDSHFEERNSNGQTRSGLFNLFIPAYDGLEGFIDEFGDSIIETPTPEQAAFIKRNIGAREYLLKKRQAYLDKGTPAALEKYREEVRLNPIWWAECFRTEGGDIGFNMEILETTMDELRYKKDVFQRGNLKWKNDIVDGEVEWEYDPEGKFEMSKVFNADYYNKKYMKDGEWYPQFPKRGICSADPFKFMSEAEFKQRKDKSKMSNGGGAAFWNRDKDLDPDIKDINEWQSYRFIMAYNYRTSDQDEYAEDMLMMSVYLGWMMYPEVNVDLVYKHFVKRGYGGFLKYDIDELTGKVKDKPGFTSLTASKQKLFNKLRDHIELHGRREKHISILTECHSIKGIEQMTMYDLFTACGGCLMGLESTFDELIDELNDSSDIGAFFGV